MHGSQRKRRTMYRSSTSSENSCRRNCGARRISTEKILVLLRYVQNALVAGEPSALYPSRDDKIALMERGGLSLRQICDFFSNIRRRLPSDNRKRLDVIESRIEAIEKLTTDRHNTDVTSTFEPTSSKADSDELNPKQLPRRHIYKSDFVTKAVDKLGCPYFEKVDRTNFHTKFTALSSSSALLSDSRLSSFAAFENGHSTSDISTVAVSVISSPSVANSSATTDDVIDSGRYECQPCSSHRSVQLLPEFSPSAPEHAVNCQLIEKFFGAFASADRKFALNDPGREPHFTQCEACLYEQRAV